MKTVVNQITQNNKIRYLALYTVLFAFIFCVGFIWYMTGYVYFMRRGDTITQHYPALIYIGRYLRELPAHLLNGEIPMYDFTIGMGDDIFATLLPHSANADIFNLLFAFVPMQGVYAMFVAVVILRLYFSGLAFSYFCFTAFSSLKSRKKIVLLGSLIYVFSGWTYVYCFWHPSFMIALLYLPLIMAGFDKVLQGKKPYIFILSVFLLGLASFYYLYMVTIALIGYALIRIHHLYGREKYLKNILIYGVKSITYFIIGLMMSAVLFLPLSLAHLISGRDAQITTNSLFYYTIDEYIKMLLSNISPLPVRYEDSSRNTRLGLSVIVPVIIIIALFQKQHKPYNKYFIITIATAFIVQNIPLGGLALNGFSYVTNRVEFIFNFIYCSCAVIALRDFTRIDKRAAAALGIYVSALLVSIFIIGNINDNEYFYFWVGFAFTFIAVLLLLIPVNNPEIRIINEKRRNIILGVFVLFNIAINVTSYQSFSNVMYVLTSAGDLFEDYADVSDYVEDDSFYRQGTSFTHSGWQFDRFDYVNVAMLSGYYGVAEYWSMANPAYMNFSSELENIDHTLEKWRIDSFDNRTILNEVTSIKYTFITYGDPPYGYEKIADIPFRRLYRNIYALPLGYTYRKSISQEEYDKLHPLDKQDALIQAVAVSDEHANTDVTKLSFTKKQIPYTAQFGNNLSWQSGILDAGTAVEPLLNDDNSTEIQMGYINIELHNDQVCSGNCETYVRIVGFDTLNPYLVDSRVYYTSTAVNFTSASTFSFSNDLLYAGRDTHLINLGYFEEPITYIVLGFEPGQFRLEDIEIYCVPMDDYVQRVTELSEDVLENVEIGINSIRGSITLSDSKTLFLSIPYSRGWSATVNGEKTELLRANTGFMAIPLESGYYEIELNYATPGIKLGAALSLAGIIVFAFIIYENKKQHRTVHERIFTENKTK